MTTTPDDPKAPHGFDSETTRADREKVHQAFLEAPVGTRWVPLEDMGIGVNDISTALEIDGCAELHPIFPLAEHFRADDAGNSGYTGNAHRGDHMTIPCAAEDGFPVMLDISFHEGCMHVEAITFDRSAPGGREKLADLNDLLFGYETR